MELPIWKRAVLGRPSQATRMRISISATNPCHLYPLAREVARLGSLGCYYSGYPAWKLPGADTLPIRAHSLRTDIVYGLLKFAPEWMRPPSNMLFVWQDLGFDRWVGRHLERCDFIHGMPGQCLHTFRAAKKLGIQTVLNHATGPVRDWVRLLEPEYARVGLRLTDFSPYDSAYFDREAEEYALADWHCAASTVVSEQLAARGIETARIWRVPYGADFTVFHPVNSAPAPEFRVVFAGHACLRKGIKTLLDALTLAAGEKWRVDFYGVVSAEVRRDLDTYSGRTPLHFHGPVGQAALAQAFRDGSVLVLPSIEEGFGLVVPQALNCGLPAIVSDRVGGKDLIRHRENGSIFPVGDAPALARELEWWAANLRRTNDNFGWTQPARTLIALSQRALNERRQPT